MTEEELNDPTVLKLEMKITATGEVRDENGVLVEQIPIEHTQLVTEAERDAILAAQGELK